MSGNFLKTPFVQSTARVLSEAGLANFPFSYLLVNLLEENSLCKSGKGLSCTDAISVT